MTDIGRVLPSLTGRKRPILLKKSALISTVEKYAFEIEIFTLNRGFRAQISRSGAQKTHFQRSVCGRFRRTDFFNRIGVLVSVFPGIP
ncbi:hypothetical protein D9M71_379170 [compost metagenome]